MKTLGIVCLLGALVLAISPLIQAQPAERGAGQDRPGRGRPPRPRIEVTEAEKADLQEEVADVESAIKALELKAATVLGDEAKAKMFTRMTVFQMLRGPRGDRPEGARQRGEGGQRGRGRERAKKGEGRGRGKSGDADIDL